MEYNMVSFKTDILSKVVFSLQMRFYIQANKWHPKTVCDAGRGLVSKKRQS